MSTPEVIVLSSDDESEVHRSKRPQTTSASSPQHSSPPSKRRRREVLVYLNDDCVVTEGLMELLIQMPQVRCCVTQQPSLYPFHIQQNDKWSCGFRNLQMIMTFLVPYLPKDHSFWQYTTPVSSSYEIPSVVQWQQFMEAAWNEGFDADGALHYRKKIVGKSVWIGAVEVASVLAFRGIDATVVQFIRCAASRRQLRPLCVSYFQRHYCQCHDSSHPCSSLELVRRLLQQTEKSKKSLQPESTCNCDIPPLYLQWKGHSVCVVGYEVETQTNGTLIHHLLAFDPMKRGSVLKKSLQRSDLKPFRVDHAKLERQDCQVVVCSTRTLPASVREGIKRNLQTATAAERAVLESLHKASR
jgi:hypothetical protein